jgi:hypothetical protein
LTKAKNVLSEKYAASLDGGKKQTAEVREARNIFMNMLLEMADYVNLKAKGNELVILSSGFDLAKHPVSKERTSFKITTNGEHGKVELKCKAVKGAVSYIFQYSQDILPETDDLWKYGCICAQTQCVIENLKSESHVWFRYAAVTRKGTEPWSEPIMKLVG